jgi:hypothetical protein
MDLGQRGVLSIPTMFPGYNLGMASSLAQRQRAADVLRDGGSQAAAAKAAARSVSSIKRWLGQPAFRAMIVSSPDIRVGAPPKVGKASGVVESQRDTRLRMWVAAGSQEVLGSYIQPAAYETPGAVLHVHVVPPADVDSVRASIVAAEYPAESPYIPVLLAGYDDGADAEAGTVCVGGSSAGCAGGLLRAGCQDHPSDD